MFTCCMVGAKESKEKELLFHFITYFVHHTTATKLLQTQTCTWSTASRWTTLCRCGCTWKFVRRNNCKVKVKNVKCQLSRTIIQLSHIFPQKNIIKNYFCTNFLLAFMRRHNFKKYTNFYVIINKKNWTELYKLQIINIYSLYTPLLWSLSLIV